MPVTFGGDAEDAYRGVLTFSDRVSELTGLLTTGTNAPADLYSILVFTTDRHLWQPHTRRVRLARPSSDGSFVIDGLPDGDYFVSAVKDVGPQDLADPAFLARVALDSVKVALSLGERVVQNLTAAK